MRVATGRTWKKPWRRAQERARIIDEVLTMLRALAAAHALALGLIAAVALAVAACAEGGGNGGKVTQRIIEPRSTAIATFDPAAALGLKAAVEVKVRPLAVKPGDDIMLRVDLVETDAYKASGAAAEKLAGGVLAFFPPARVGDERTFVVPLGREGRGFAKATSLTALVTVIAANPERDIAGVRLELVEARLR